MKYTAKNSDVKNRVPQSDVEKAEKLHPFICDDCFNSILDGLTLSDEKIKEILPQNESKYSHLENVPFKIAYSEDLSVSTKTWGKYFDPLMTTVIWFLGIFEKYEEAAIRNIFAELTDEQKAVAQLSRYLFLSISRDFSPLTAGRIFSNKLEFLDTRTSDEFPVRRIRKNSRKTASPVTSSSHSI
jgi:hypothetical protein